jgi:hypothetical protein
MSVINFDYNPEWKENHFPQNPDFISNKNPKNERKT